ncbi:hypothetical protein CERSUDRAFT_121627 [Gelatoporia subvermispora B]|uniref:BRCA1-associated protein n=1 Tax=Ceriporiopsis subvermispora (strain B) TaxID=914234 RepID=M2QVB3_CERS8|nr:hypothetical protein CERSUDRAFT_121627 [Gelatoporia subvermispora B]
MSVGAKKAGFGKGRENREPVVATFVSQPVPTSKSGSTNLPKGVVRIFRDYPSSAEQEPSSSSTPNSGEAENAINSASATDGPQPVDSDLDISSVTLGVLAVPSWMTPADFLAFVAPASEGIAHLRMIRDFAPNRSIVVLHFRTPAEATEFAEAYNGKQFNSMEPEICHVVRIRSVTIDTDDPVSQVVLPPGGQSQGSATMYELPTCPVCLERMDSSVTGLVTVPCSHTFHCACLSKWGDSRCPVCRYSQTLMSSHPSSSNTTRSTHPIPFSSNAASRSQCADCGGTTNLWICLVCGNIGCGRYGRAHAHAHYTQTTHLYALELETQRVWDYAGDGYVHRLIQNKADGKLVELPSAATAAGSRGDGGSGAGPSAADALSAEKIEAIGIEYSYLLMSQLDSQRAYYEEQTADLRSQVEQMRGLVEKLSVEVGGAQTRLREYETRQRVEEDARVAEVGREKQKAEKRAEKAAELARNLAKELQEERAVSEGLMKNLAKAKDIAEQAMRDKAQIQLKVQELEDQVRDVMFFLEARDKIESGEGDIAEAAGGSIETATNPQRSRKGKKGSPEELGVDFLRLNFPPAQYDCQVSSQTLSMTLLSNTFGRTTFAELVLRSFLVLAIL